MPKPPAVPFKRRTPTQRSACGKRGEAVRRDGPCKPPGACSCFRQQERARAAVNGLDPVVPHGGVPFAVSRINRAYEEVYGCRGARFSPRFEFPKKAADQPARRRQRSISRRFARDEERRPPACVRTRSLRGMPAQRISNLSQQQAPQGVRGACSLAQLSTLNSLRSTLYAPRGAARVPRKVEQPVASCHGHVRARKE